MKIHLANTYGFDKQSLNDREMFATNHMDDINDSAENPLGVSIRVSGTSNELTCIGRANDGGLALKTHGSVWRRAWSSTQQ